MILVGTDDGFATVGVDAPRLPSGHRMDAIAVTTSGIWAVGDGADLWHHPRGSEGKVVASLRDGRANCVAVREDMVLVGGSAARLFRFTGNDLEAVRTFDNAPGRDTWSTPWGDPPDVRSIAIDPQGLVYVNVHVGGVLCSSDLDRWRPTVEISADVHQILVDDAGVAWAAAAIGLGMSRDGGTSWSFETSGLDGAYCRAIAVGSEWLYLSASRGSSGGDAAVYRRPRDGSAPLRRCVDGLPERFSGNVDTFCLAATGRAVAIAAPDGTVYESADSGLSWRLAATGLPGVHCAAYVSS